MKLLIHSFITNALILKRTIYLTNINWHHDHYFCTISFVSIKFAFHVLYVEKVFDENANTFHAAIPKHRSFWSGEVQLHRKHQDWLVTSVLFFFSVWLVAVIAGTVFTLWILSFL